MGPGSATLDPKPRSLRDPRWHAATTDERIAQVVVNGGPSIGLSPTMPGYPALRSEPEVADALVKLIRSFKE
jgi:hypothetical protein